MIQSNFTDTISIAYGCVYAVCERVCLCVFLCGSDDGDDDDGSIELTVQSIGIQMNDSFRYTCL